MQPLIGAGTPNSVPPPPPNAVLPPPPQPPQPEDARFAVVTSEWNQFKVKEYSVETDAWRNSAALKCNWVLYRVDSAGYTEIGTGGFGLATPSIRKHVASSLAPKLRSSASRAAVGSAIDAHPEGKVLTAETVGAEASSSSSSILTPTKECRAGWLGCVAAADDDAAPAARAATLKRWCVIENGELYVLPSASSTAAEVEMLLPLVCVRRAFCPTELQAGGSHVVELTLSDQAHSRKGLRGVHGQCTRLVLVASSADEQKSWQQSFEKIATSLRMYRRVSDVPGAVASGAKWMGKIAAGAMAGGAGWEVGRDVGHSVSKAVGLR